MRTTKSTFSITFYLRKDKMKKNSFTPIFCRVTIAGEAVSFNIHADIHIDLWDPASNQAKGKTKEAIAINRVLDSCKTTLHNMYRDIFDRDNFVSAEKLKNTFLGISDDNTMLLELFRQHNKDVETLIGINKTKATLQKYKVTYTRLHDFMKFRYNISDINLKEIKYQFVVDFENYLRTESKCSANTTAKFIQFFKRIIIIARNNGWIQHDPFANYKIRIKKVDRGYLTAEELHSIQNKKLVVDRLDKVRDIFIFSCMTNLEDKKQRKANHGNGLIVRNERPLVALSV